MNDFWIQSSLDGKHLLVQARHPGARQWLFNRLNGVLPNRVWNAIKNTTPAGVPDSATVLRDLEAAGFSFVVC